MYLSFKKLYCCAGEMLKYNPSCPNSLNLPLTPVPCLSFKYVDLRRFWTKWLLKDIERITLCSSLGCGWLLACKVSFCDTVCYPV